MPVLFNSITQFVEAVGRRREHRAQPDQLDTLDCVFTGPGPLTSTVCPHDLAVHPVFTGMNCVGWNVVDKEALVAEVHAQYTGKLDAGSGPYTSKKPIITTSRHLGAISYTTSYSRTPIQVATVSFSVRYIAKGVTFKYLTNRRPAAGFNGNFASKAKPYLGATLAQQFMTGLTVATGAPDSGYVESSLVFQNDLTDLPVNDLGNNWYEVTEVYMTNCYVNTSVSGTPGAEGTFGNTLNSIDFTPPAS